MAFLVRMSIGAMEVVLALPELWIALGAILAAALVAATRRTGAVPASERRRNVELSALVISPVVALAVGAIFRNSPSLLPLYALSVLALGHLGWAVAVVWRHRLRLRSTLPIALVTTWWAAGAHLTAAMAVTNIWI